MGAPTPYPAGSAHLYVVDLPTGATTALPGVRTDSMATVRFDLTPDGRHVALATQARLSPADQDDTVDVYVRDRTTGTTTFASPSQTWVLHGAYEPRLSADGRRLATGVGIDLGASVGQRANVVVRDLDSGTYSLMSRNLAGEPGLRSDLVGIDDAGSRVVFHSDAPDMAPPASPGWLVPYFTGGVDALQPTPVIPVVGEDARSVEGHSTNRDLSRLVYTQRGGSFLGSFCDPVLVRALA